MNHSVYGKKLSRNTDERKRLRTGLVSDLFLHGFVMTTQAKALAVRPLAESLITKAKKGRSSDIYEIRRVIKGRSVYQTLFGQIVPAVSGHAGGYTRIIKVGFRRGDNASMVRLELVKNPSLIAPVNTKMTQKKGVKEASIKEKATKKRGRPAKAK
jgi:large subunit ribosomal protein L17